MSYTALYRKFRPARFEDVKGQDHIVTTLRNQIKSDKIQHAYLFCGTRGTGKTSVAKLFAKAINCEHPVDGNPCLECPTCKAIASQSALNVVEIDAASNNGVDNIRQIIEEIAYPPTDGRFKVYIIDEVHMLSTSAFNALLKTLEEPPAHVIFILATTEIRKVPVTILSRCQRFDLVRVPVETLKKHFAWIAEQEKVELSDAANDLLARAADGSVRDGLSLLDQAIAQTGGHVDETSVMDMLKRADRGVVVDFMQTILSGNVAAAIAKADEIYTNGADLSMLLTDMMEWTHWATRMHPVLRAGESNHSPYTADQRAKIEAIDKHVSLNTLSRIWQVMVASVPEMAAATNQKQCFDMLVIRLMHIADMPSIPEMMKQDKIATPRVAPVPEPKKETICIKTATDLADALQAAREIMLYSYFAKNIEISEIAGNKISYFDRGNDSEFQSKIVKWLNEKTGENWVMNKIQESEQKQTVREQVKSDVESDPMVADAMSLFEGAEIVGISKQ